jgi:hypothetical protein
LAKLIDIYFSGGNFMGIELTNMELEDLDNILHEISRGNTRDMTTFRDVLLEMYGGMNIKQYQKLESFLRSELGLNSDSELWNMDNQQKLKVIEFLH